MGFRHVGLYSRRSKQPLRRLLWMTTDQSHPWRKRSLSNGFASAAISGTRPCRWPKTLEQLVALVLGYVAQILSTTSAWGPGEAPLPRSVKALALALPETAWRDVRWREGTAGALTSRFARLRVR